MASKIKNENFVTIQGFMINDLGLSGNELIAYAVIYGFSQADGQFMTCSQEYISNWVNLNRESTNRLLKRLVDKKLIIKKLAVVRGAIKMYDYKAVVPTSDETSHDETSPARVTKRHNTSDETSHHNINNNKPGYIDTKTPKNEKNRFKKFPQRTYSDSEMADLENALINSTLFDEMQN